MSSSTLSLPACSPSFDLFIFLLAFRVPVPSSLEFPTFPDPFARIPFPSLVERFPALGPSDPKLRVSPRLQLLSCDSPSARSCSITLSPFFHVLGAPRLPSLHNGVRASCAVASSRTVDPFVPRGAPAGPALFSSVPGGLLPLLGITSSRSRPWHDSVGTRHRGVTTGGEEDAEKKRRRQRW